MYIYIFFSSKFTAKTFTADTRTLRTTRINLQFLVHHGDTKKYLLVNCFVSWQNVNVLNNMT